MAVVVVTGASAGVGRAVARMFAERGDRVAMLARGAAGLAAATREIDGHTLAVPVDVSDHEALDRAADTVERELGPIEHHHGPPTRR